MVVLGSEMNKLFYRILVITLLSTHHSFSKEKTIVINAILPERIEFFAEDPPCQCLWTDYFSVRNIDNDTDINFEDDNRKKLKKYYYVERETEPSETPPYGSTILRLKQHYRGRVIQVSYSRKLCKKYRECRMGKIYKNIVISIK